MSTYFVAVLDFLYEDAKFLRQVVLKDQQYEQFCEKLLLTFLQMQAFTKNESEMSSKLDKWALFFQKLGLPTESIATAENKSIEEVKPILAKHQSPPAQ